MEDKIKNHKQVNGKLLQTNKTFSHLKNSQKEFISNELYNELKRYIIEKGKYPKKLGKLDIIDNVYEKIEDRGIWIPYYEVEKYFYRKLNKYKKRLIKEGLLEDDKSE